MLYMTYTAAVEMYFYLSDQWMNTHNNNNIYLVLEVSKQVPNLFKALKAVEA